MRSSGPTQPGHPDIARPRSAQASGASVIASDLDSSCPAAGAWSRGGLSKKVDNLKANVALHYMHYNFGRIHKTLRVTPAMEAGKADHVWSLEEIAGLAD